MSAVCGRAAEYHAGLLSVEDERRFLDHAATCATCHADLEDEVQLAALEERLVPARVLPFRRRRAVTVALTAAGIAAAAGIAGWLTLRRPAPTPVVASLTLAPTRSFEPRLSYPAADGYRPYDVARGSAAPLGERIAPDVVAELARRGDTRGTVAAYLLGGERAHAAQTLAGAAGSPELDSDRAALALAGADPEAALVSADRALDERPDLPQALWNRALALRDLGLGLAAADGFARVAAVDPVWRGEAEQRAASLRGAREEVRAAWYAAQTAGHAMVEGGPPLTAATARRFPGVARLYFYDALRTAGSKERVAELAPLAEALDAWYGGKVLAAAVARAEKHAFAARAGLTDEYRKMIVYKSTLDDAGWRRWAAAARGAGADDLLMGALVATSRASDALDDYRRMVKAAGDPWFDILLLDVEARRARLAGDARAAEAELVAARLACGETAMAYRCTQLDLALARLHSDAHRTTQARGHAASALRGARAGNEWGLELRALDLLGEIERFSGRNALARAYLTELGDGAVAECAMARAARASLAEMSVIEHRPGRAFAEASSAPRCDQPMDYGELQVAVDLARGGRPLVDAATVRAQIDGYRRSSRLTPGERSYADYLEGRLVLDDDPERGRTLLEGAIAAGGRGDEVVARKARAYAYTALLVDAGRRGAYAEVFSRFADELGWNGAGCAVAIANDDARLVVAARGRDGAIVGHYQADRTDFTPGVLVPSDLVVSLRGCEAIAVLAQPPLLGAPGLLPPSSAWSYRLPRAASVTAATDRAGKRVVVAGVEPPARLGLAALRDWDVAPAASGAVVLRGAEASPGRVLAELPGAEEIEVHAHTVSDLDLSDVPLLALSPDPDGRYALTAQMIQGLRLPHHPIVVLADCRAADMAPYLYRAWSLPTAFLLAGARAVLAAPVEIPDADASRFFADVMTAIHAGAPAAAGLAATRARWLARDPTSWVANVLIFE